jgi:hypothetical protein
MDIDKHDAEQRIATLENEKMQARLDLQAALTAREHAEAGARENARKGTNFSHTFSQGDDIGFYPRGSTVLGRAAIKIGWICLLVFLVGLKFPFVYWVMTQEHWLVVGIICLVLGYFAQFIAIFGVIFALGNLYIHTFTWGELVFSVGVVLLSVVCASLFRRVKDE